MIPDQLRAAQDRAAAQAADRELTPEPGGAGGRVARADDEAALLKTHGLGKVAFHQFSSSLTGR